MPKKLGWTDGICDNPDRREYSGQPCQCAGCRPENHCIPEFGGCSECDGPVLGCDHNDDAEEEGF